MIIDFRTDTTENNIECDLCIIGAGAAGITIAREFIGTDINVVMLESGGLEYSAESQALYEGESPGLQNASPTACRLRYLGGTTNHWEGWCAQLRESDFKQRPWVKNSGWPFQKAELSAWYPKAQSICQVGSFDYQPGTMINEKHDFPAFDPNKANIDFFRFSPPTRFGQVYREALEKAANVRVFLHSNVLSIETDKAASSTNEIKISTLNGKAGTVRARFYVLACGGMENPRMLLLSNTANPAGLGNQHDLVGRYFLQHIEGNVARILVTNQKKMTRNFKRYSHNNIDARPEVSLSAQAQETGKILGSGFTIHANEQYGTGYKTLIKLWRDIKKGRWPDEFGDKLWSVITDLGAISDDVFKQKSHSMNLYIRAESSPNPESRITLSDDLDQLGLRKIHVNWQLTAFDKISIIESTHRIAEELGHLNLGRVELEDWLLEKDNNWPQPLWTGCHHMGTTRMSDTPETGVVDRNCRIHGMNNLYVAGSSVFPTAGYVPPTLTIVALALRLSDHLKQQLKNS
ncbi:MAG: GMC family oxidoreductase [Gammaproteobacteria bacterium]